MRIVAISDTHGQHRRISIPDGDILVVAGDWTYGEQISSLNVFFRGLPHKHKVLIAGNHDFILERHPEAAGELKDCLYLMDSSVTVMGLKFYGSPWQPRFFDWAFNLDRPELKTVWAKIPSDTDILITHGPPYGILDVNNERHHCGCHELAERLKTVRPKLHIFGHIHEGYGWKEVNGTLYVNASICNVRNVPHKEAVIIDYDPGSGRGEVYPLLSNTLK